MSGDSGARHDRVSIKDETFFEMPIHLPSNTEQKKIAIFLFLLEKKLESLDDEMMKNATNSAKLSELTAKQEEVQKALEEKMERWMYLEELAAKIAEQ